MFNPIKKDDKYLKDKIFVGVVEENVDERRKGRIKVRVQGVFEDIEVKHIPWASPFRSIDGRSFGIPGIGKIVNVVFPNGNLYEPQYIYSENYNINLQNFLDQIDDDEYKNFVALLFDHRSQVYTDDIELKLDYYLNNVSINKRAIELNLKDNNQKIKLGTEGADQRAVLGTNFFDWMDGFMQTLLTPTTMVGNFGAPILRPALDQKILEYQAKRPTFWSNNVYINDNYKIEKIADRPLQTQAKVQDSTTLNGINSTGDKVDKKPAQPTPKPEPGEPEKPLEEKIVEENQKEIDENIKNSSNGGSNAEFGSHDTDRMIGIAAEETDGKATIIISEDTDIQAIYDEEWTDANNPMGEEGVVVGEDGERLNEKINKSKTVDVKEGKYTTSDIEESDPYAGFWANRKGRAASDVPTSVNSQDGYGSYSTGGGGSDDLSLDYNKEFLNVSASDGDINFTKYYKMDGILGLMAKKKGAYRQNGVKKTKIVIHWTGGWGHADSAPNTWIAGMKNLLKNDPSNAYAQGTSWGIGGPLKNTVTERYPNDMYDGKIYNYFSDDEFYTCHSSVGGYLDQRTVGIEVSSLGTFQKQGNIWTALGGAVKFNSYDVTPYVSKIPDSWGTFKGQKYFQRLSDAQLVSLKKLIYYLANKHNIQLEKPTSANGLYSKDWFEGKGRWAGFWKKADYNGIYIHAHPSGKLDFAPTVEFVDLLMSL